MAYDPFAYTPGDVPWEVYQNVSYTIDMLKTAGNVVMFGVIERVSGTTAKWMGGLPIWQMNTAGTPVVGDDGVVRNGLITQVGEVAWIASGTALSIINQEGDKLVTDFKGEIQAILDARFPVAQPTATGGNIVGPPFTNEDVAIAWILTRPRVLLRNPVNGKIT